MSTTEAEQANWHHVDTESSTYTNGGYGLSFKMDTNGLGDLPSIVLESQGNNCALNITDAPIVIFPNDPSCLVGAEEVVMEESLEWDLPTDDDDDVAVNDVDSTGAWDDLPDIPMSSLGMFHPFPCDFCNRRFKKKANLMNHMVAHQTVRPHSCNICSSCFMRKCDLVNHMKIHAYLPNRDNRNNFKSDSDQESSYSHEKSKLSRSRKSAASGSSRRTLGRRTPSPFRSSPDKSTNYIEEDVKLLLEMTTKLHGSHKSEDDDNEPSFGSSRKSALSSSKPYECRVCKRCFARESALISHSQVHAEDIAYHCKKCSSRFFSVPMLSEHLRKKHNMSYSDDEEEPANTKGYTGDERFSMYHCKTCGKSFKRQDAFKAHKKEHDRELSIHRCGSCGSQYYSKEKLLEHLDVTTACQNNVCLLCGEMFPDQQLTQSHIKLKHGRDLPANTCDYCGKQCNNAHSLRKHLWLHQTDTRYICKEPMCSKKFSSEGELKRHMPTHDPKNWEECKECRVTFSNRQALLNHQMNHRSSSNGRRFFCSDCGKSFGSRSSQQIHYRIHTGEKPYGCRYCWKAFADGGTLRKHERIHTGEKPYACAVCPRAFNQRVVLREHIRSHHLGVENKLEQSDAVYLCPVCGVECRSSEELAGHLIKHCDANTRSNRVLSSKKRINPGKIKKSNSQSYAPTAFDDDSGTDSAFSEKEMDGWVAADPPRRRTDFSKFNHVLDAAVKNISSIVEPKKAKMINTTNSSKGKKRGPKKKTRRAEPPLVVSKPRTRTLSGRISSRKDSSDASQQECIRTRGVVGRPRTKNVSYESLRALEKTYEPATFPQIVDNHMDEEDSKPIKVDVSESSDLECLICRQLFTSKTDYLCHVQLHI